VDELLEEHFSSDSLLSGPALDRARSGIAEFPVEEAPAQMIGAIQNLADSSAPWYLAQRLGLR
jgi:hypothetical protein